MTAAPRFWHCGTNVFSSQLRSVMTSVAGLPLIFALVKSGYCVLLWLPQMVTAGDVGVGDAGLLAPGRCGRGCGPAGSWRSSARRESPGRCCRPPGSWCCTGCRRPGCARRSAAFAASALPWPTKILPLMPSRSLRSMPWLAREGADQQRPVARRRTPCWDRRCTTMSCSVGKPQSSSSMATPSQRLGMAPGGRDLQQLQDDLRVRPEHLAGGQPAQHGIGHLPGRPGHRHANRVAHGIALSLWRIGSRPRRRKP